MQRDDTPSSVLAVYAHPDDPEISAGGTLARWADAGATVWVLICTRGEKGSSDPDEDLDVLARRRVEETQSAGVVLGLRGQVHFEHGDGELENDVGLRKAIVEQIRTLRPEVVVCPDPTAILFGDRYINHRDHRAVGMATLDSVAPAAGNPHYFPEHLASGLAAHQVSALYLSGTLEPNCWIDIGETLDRKIEALFCHASQLQETGEWFREFLRERAKDAGSEAGLNYAESFRRLHLGG